MFLAESSFEPPTVFVCPWYMHGSMSARTYISRLQVDPVTNLHVLDVTRYGIADLCHILNVGYPAISLSDVKRAKAGINLSFHPDKVQNMEVYYTFFRAAFNRVKRAFDMHERTNQTVTSSNYVVQDVDYSDIVVESDLDRERNKVDRHGWWRSPVEGPGRNYDAPVVAKSYEAIPVQSYAGMFSDDREQTQMVVRRSDVVRFGDKVVGESAVLALNGEDGYHSFYRTQQSDMSRLQYDDIRKVYGDKPRQYERYNSKVASHSFDSDAARKSALTSADWTVSSVPMVPTVRY